IAMFAQQRLTALVERLANDVQILAGKQVLDVGEPLTDEWNGSQQKVAPFFFGKTTGETDDRRVAEMMLIAKRSNPGLSWRFQLDRGINDGRLLADVLDER